MLAGVLLAIESYMSRFVKCSTYQIVIQAWKKFEIIKKKGKSHLSYNQLIQFRYQNSMRRLKLELEKYHQDLDQQLMSTNKSQGTQIGN